MSALALLAQPLSFNEPQQLGVLDGAIGRLLVACVLGGAVGLDRELNRKAAGVRTNLLICMGAAFFTLLSPVIAGDIGTNKGQIASNIVQGIGFLGAGLILHNRSRINGLTSAATVSLDTTAATTHEPSLRRGNLIAHTDRLLPG